MTGVPLGDAQDLARRVLDRVEDCAIRMASMNIAAGSPTREVSLRTDTSLSLATATYPGVIVCMSRYSVSAEAVDRPSEDAEADQAGDEDSWSVVIEMHGMWTLAGEERPADDEAQAFTLAVGAMALHPYVRSQVQSSVTAAGYPPYSMDILRSLMTADENGLVELDVVSANFEN